MPRKGSEAWWNEPAYKGSFMSRREQKKDWEEFKKTRPKEAAAHEKSVKEIRKRNREEQWGKGVRTRGKHKGLKKGTGTQEWR